MKVHEVVEMEVSDPRTDQIDQHCLFAVVCLLSTKARDLSICRPHFALTLLAGCASILNANVCPELLLAYT